ncbi:hypothetical protein PSE_3290 [Pseudovibrio sp. FO-BEG1]|nr:hypothetical protein PSE_3290 [Pseudovibrio sp. FO-BEG1]
MIRIECIYQCNHISSVRSETCCTLALRVSVPVSYKFSGP